MLMPISVTEVDIRMPTPPTAESLAQQAADYSKHCLCCVAQYLAKKFSRNRCERMPEH